MKEKKLLGSPQIKEKFATRSKLIPLFNRTGRANFGCTLETAVLIELQRRRCKVTYVRTMDCCEVNFLAHAPDGAEYLIQVCAGATDPDTAGRELHGLLGDGGSSPRSPTLATYTHA